jgi:transposase-like protein
MAKPVLSAPQFQNETAAFAYVEAHLWPKGPVCPHCGETARIGRLNGKTTRPGLLKCYACKKPFTVRMGTLFEDSHLPLHLWLQVIHLMCCSKKGIATRQIQRMLRCSMKTAWFLGHRIREAMTEYRGIFTEPMGGADKVVEADETYVGRKAESKAFLAPAKKESVFALVERKGMVRSFHVSNVRAETLRSIMARNISMKSHLMTDEARTYTYVGHNFASHGTVAHAAKEYVRDDVHTNTIEGYFSILKRGLIGVYQHVSEPHLKRYLSEFDFRYNNRIALGVDDSRRAETALNGVKGKRLTYQTTRRERPIAQA